MKPRIVLCSALIAIVAAAPTAATARTTQVARGQHAQASQGIGEGVATAIAAEIVKAGVKAAIAEWAPDLTKYVDPTAYGIAQIQAKLEEISGKLTQLINAQDALGAKLSCELQQASVSRDLADIKAWYHAMVQARYSSFDVRKADLETLYSHRFSMHSVQIHLHDALVGNGVPSLLRACGKNVEKAMYPYMSAFLGHEMHRLYSIYHVASAELLVVRVNMMALHPQPDQAESAARQLETYWAEEQTAHFIKPVFPLLDSYDKRTDTLYRVNVIPSGDVTERKNLQANGWYVTGHNGIPTCSAIAHFTTAKRDEGYIGWASINYLREIHVLNLWGGHLILCYDDNDHLQDFSLATYTYYYAGNIQSYQPSIAAKANNGYYDISNYGYGG